MTHPVEITFTETATDRLAGHQGRVAMIVAPGGDLPPGLPEAAHQAAQRALH